MAKGSFVTSEFNNGCKFKIEWEQIQYPDRMESEIKFDVWFYNPTDSKLVIWDPFANIYFDGSAANSRIMISFGDSNRYDGFVFDNKFELYGRGYHRLADYSSSYLFATDVATVQHYPSGLPKNAYSTYTIDDTYNLGQVFMEIGGELTYFKAYFNSGTITLDPMEAYNPGEDEEVTIKKPSTAICSDTYIGDQAKITITANEKDVKHTIVYTFGSLTGSVIVQSSNLSIAWEVPYNFIYEIPTGASHGTCYLNIHTYDKDGGVIGVTSTSFIARMDVNKEAPTFDPIIVDKNSKTLELTGDENIFIRYYSNAYVDIGAVGKLGATIMSQEVQCAGKRSFVSPTTLYNVESANFELTATDSRNATAKTVINKILIPYTKISCNVFDLNLTADGTLTFLVQGNYFNDTFGKVSNTLNVRYRLNDGAYTQVSASNIKITGHNYDANVTVTGLQYDQIYNVEVVAEDKLSSAGEGSIYNITGEPIFDWSKEDFNFNIQVKAQKGIQIGLDEAVYGNDQGELHEALVPLDSTGNTVLGRGGYLRNIGDTIIYGSNVDILTHEDVTINGRSIINNKVLWQGSSQMGASHYVDLSEGISKQPNGIVLVFSLYRNGAAEDVSINSFFISKKEVELLPGAPHMFILGINSGFSSMAGKYIYIDDTRLSGHEGNEQTGSSVISFNNSNYVLRYVIGV